MHSSVTAVGALRRRRAGYSRSSTTAPTWSLVAITMIVCTEFNYYYSGGGEGGRVYDNKEADRLLALRSRYKLPTTRARVSLSLSP